jgi:hypothetical protein
MAMRTAAGGKHVRSWKFYAVAGALLLGVFVWANGHVFQGVSVGSHLFSLGSSVAEGTSSDSDAAASDSMTSALADALGNVTGLNDMAVIPDGNGGGQYLVSAVVSLTGTSSGGGTTGSLQNAMDTSVDTFFKDVYGTDQPISQAEITFQLQDGTIVGTAGLGKDAYAKMASTTLQGDLASTLNAMSPVQENSSSDAWFEMSTGQ